MIAPPNPPSALYLCVGGILRWLCGGPTCPRTFINSNFILTIIRAYREMSSGRDSLFAHSIAKVQKLFNDIFSQCKWSVNGCMLIRQTARKTECRVDSWRSTAARLDEHV